MNLYLAPLEGITGHIYRNALHQCFDGFDKYFIPFISPNQKGHFSTREKKDVMPEHNQGMYAVPQILTNNVEDFLSTAQKLGDYGYKEVNLNLGCPSRTVVTKGRGAGFLDEPQKLDRFLDAVFEKCNLEISIKTRIGMEDPEEFETILPIYNKYPLKELIIHPRVQKDMYNNKPNWEVFAQCVQESKNPLCYNGDIFTVADYQRFCDAFPQVEAVMLGRGILRNPGLLDEIRYHKPLDMGVLRQFHDEILQGYEAAFSGDKPVLFKMKELWGYLLPLFPNSSDFAKKIRKVERISEYKGIADNIFSNN